MYVNSRAGLLASALALLAAGPMAAQEFTDLFPARPAGHVTDAAGLLPSGAVPRLEQTLRTLRDSTGVNVALVTLPTLADRPAVDVAVAIGRAWGVGAVGAVGDARRNAGAVILVVPREAATGRRHCFIATSGLFQGTLTDLRASRLCRALNVAGKAGGYPGGLAAIVDGVADAARAFAADLPAQARPDSPPWIPALLFFGLLVLIVAVVRRLSASPRRPADSRDTSYVDSVEPGGGSDASSSGSFDGGGGYDGGGGGSSSD